MLLDPIVLDEKRKRAVARRNNLGKAEQGYEALLHFSRMDRQSGEEIIVTAKTVASATGGAKQADNYLARAAKTVAGMIVDHAIVMAQADAALASEEDSN